MTLAQLKASPFYASFHLFSRPIKAADTFSFREVFLQEKMQKCQVQALNWTNLFQDLMYLSDKPDFSLVQTLLDSLQLELRLLLDPPDGSRERPATTCLELRLCHPEYSSGQRLSSHQHRKHNKDYLMSQLVTPNVYSLRSGAEAAQTWRSFNFDTFCSRAG